MNKTFSSLYFDEIIRSSKNLEMTFFAREPRKYYNSAQSISPHLVLSSKNVKQIVDLYHSKCCTPGIHLVRPWLTLTDVDCIQSAGFENIPPEEENWWIKDLTLNSYCNSQQSSTLVLAQSRAEIESFVEINEICNELSTAEAEILFQKLLKRPQWLLPFIIYQHDKPAGVAALSLIHGLAGFAEGGVLPEFRGQGLHRFSFVKRCELARTHGARFAVMNCLASSYSNNTAASAGFHLFFQRDFFQMK